MTFVRTKAAMNIRAEGDGSVTVSQAQTGRFNPQYQEAGER